MRDVEDFLKRQEEAIAAADEEAQAAAKNLQEAAAVLSGKGLMDDRFEDGLPLEREYKHPRFIYNVDARQISFLDGREAQDLTITQAEIFTQFLRHPNRMLPREFLIERVWPGGVFADPVHTLNVNVARLRKTLGDTDENSRIIETSPGAGYKLIDPSRTTLRRQVGGPQTNQANGGNGGK